MTDAAMLRDSTQILVPEPALDDIRDELETRFTLTFLDEETRVRIVGSPIEIKKASQFLSRNGVPLQ
jgi:hypothetical protein